MGQDFFTYLPSEMIMNILSRLPIRSIIRCKFVCKSWLDLLATPEFVKSHLSKAAPGLALFLYAEHPKPYKFFEFVDKLNLHRRVLHWNMDTVFNFNLPFARPLHSSANGLLFLCRRGAGHHDFYKLRQDGAIWPRNLLICNPITRDYIMIPRPQESSPKAQLHMDSFGFGVSRMSGQYKLVWRFHEWIRGTRPPGNFAESECQVYTVGTGSWRRVGSGGRSLLYIRGNDVGVFLNGNLHWLALEREGSSVWISCFDLETELFSTFSPPPLLHRSDTCSRILSALGECLCLCDNSADDEIVIWLMKEYGDEKSWTKEFIIPKISPVEYSGILRPIKVFEKGGILMAWEADSRVLYFTSKTIAIRKLDLFELNVDYNVHAIMYTPSFVSLKTFAMENVTSF
ncbi:hypothetical protein C2S52_014260 [Perilla frutescens var. hirtella]|uniref:F-box domain-containing protein n=1 Tax=Perilla frutescens var. hirtella TaxID=608512 RepID=A0AAD4P476_PERFH|nr:hypothetical protein C2S51_016458 [Perilla frutescens var. frutescens]KAH6776699.1 hypothetical protein C2S52_014260 [Perilla frutescens var. hirtella]KAH6826253.1 hypothetical protein C2S53_001690 [Perilla frutescens var. hirtella]